MATATILDTIPGSIRAGAAFPLDLGLKLNHVCFHGGNPDLAAMLVSQNVEGYLRRFLTSLGFNYGPAVFSEEDIAAYVRVTGSRLRRTSLAVQWSGVGTSSRSNAPNS